MSDRDAHLNISATDKASGPLRNIASQANRLQEAFENFDGSRADASFAKIARAAAAGGRSIEQTTKVIDESIAASARNLAAHDKVIAQHQQSAKKALEDAKRNQGASESLSRGVADSAQKIKDLEKKRSDQIISARKAESDRLVRETVTIARAEAKKIEGQLSERVAGRELLKGRKGEDAATARKLADREISALRSRMRSMSSLEASLSKSGMTGANRDRASDLLGSARVPSARPVSSAGADAIAAEIASAKAQLARDEQSAAAFAKSAKESREAAERAEREAKKALAMRSAEDERQKRLIVTRQKAGVMADEYGSRVSSVGAARADFDRRRDPREAAASVDKIAGANGEIERTAQGMKRLAKETDGAASAAKRHRVAAASSSSALNGLKSSLAGLISLYMVLQTAADQSAKAVEAFRSKQAFETRINFTNGDDVRDTAAQLSYVRKLAEDYGLEILNLQARYSAFASASNAINLSVEDTQTVFNGMAAAARVGKLSTDEFGRSMTAITQMVGKNQIMAEELKSQLAESWPQAIGTFAEALGYASDDQATFLKDMENGMFKARDVIKVFEFVEKRYSGAALKAGDTFEGVMNRFLNSLTYAREQFANAGLIDGLMEFMTRSREFFESEDGQKFFVSAGVAAQKFLQVMAYVVEHIDTIGKLLAGMFLAKIGMSVVGFFAPIIAGLTTAARVSVLVAKNFTNLAKVMRILRVAMVGISGPIGAIVGALALASPWIISMLGSGSAKNKIENVERAKAVEEAISEIGNAAVEAKGDVDAFQKSLNDIGKQKIDDALANSLLKSADAAIEANRRVKEAIIGRVQASTGRKVNLDHDRVVRSSSLPSARAIQSDWNDLRLGKITISEYDDRIDRLKKIGVLEGKVADEMKKGARALVASNDNTKMLTKSQSALTDGTAAAELMNDSYKKSVEESARRVKEIGKEIEKFHSEAEDNKPLADARKKFEEVGNEAKKLRDGLEALRDTMDPAEYAKRSQQITDRMKSDFGALTAAIYEADAAAKGFDINVSAKMAAVANGINGVGDGSESLPKSEKAAAVRKALIDRGLPAHVADAINANIQDESGFRTNAVEGAPNVYGTRGYGLLQWTNTPGSARRTRLENYASSSGKDLDSVSTQADFIFEELNTTHKSVMDALLKSKSTAEAAQIFNNRYLIPAKKYRDQRNARYVNLQNTAEGAAPVGAGASLTSDQSAAIQDVSSVSGDFGSSAKDVLSEAALKYDLSNNSEWLLAIKESRVEDVAAEIEKHDADMAKRFREASTGTAVGEATDKRVEGVEKLKKGTEEADKEIIEADREARNAAIVEDREREIKKIRDGLADRVKAGEITSEKSEEIFASQIGAYDAGVTAERDKALRDSAKDSKARVEDARAANDLAAEEARARREAANSGLKGAQAEEFVRNRMAAHRAEADAASSKATRQSVRDAENAVALEKEKSGLQKALMAERQKMAEEEASSGISISSSDRAARLRAAGDAFKAANPNWMVEDIQANNDTSVLEARSGTLKSQLESAISKGDLTGAERIRAEIRGVNDEMLKAIDTQLILLRGFDGPEAKKAVANLEQQKLEIQNNRDGISQYGQAAEYWGKQAGDVLSGGVSAFAKAVAESENPWRALMSTVAMSVGQILIDIGSMITKAIIADQVMRMLGLNDGQAAPGSVASGGGGFLGKILTAGFNILSGNSTPVHHEGGKSGDTSARRNLPVAGLGLNLAADEELSVLRRNEEVLTADDPRHVDNLSAAASELSGIRGASRRSVSSVGGSVSSGGKGGDFSSPASSAIDSFQNAPAPIKGSGDVTINNHFDADEFVSRAIASPRGQKSILNLISRNPKRFKAALGQS